MHDGAVIVDHPRLRTSDVEALPANLSTIHRLQLAAVPRRSHEQDVGLWMRAHREAHPHARTASHRRKTTATSSASTTHPPLRGIGTGTRGLREPGPPGSSGRSLVARTFGTVSDSRGPSRITVRSTVPPPLYSP